jgi:hypothetical protein
MSSLWFFRPDDVPEVGLDQQAEVTEQCEEDFV